ncbi:MAG: hypothetical protein N4Q32_01095 [Neisseriaceae bacterium]|nr:hypothetical protein [Neisseriaceae bacterium]
MQKKIIPVLLMMLVGSVSLSATTESKIDKISHHVDKAAEVYNTIKNATEDQVKTGTITETTDVGEQKVEKAVSKTTDKAGNQIEKEVNKTTDKTTGKIAQTEKEVSKTTDEVTGQVDKTEKIKTTISDKDKKKKDLEAGLGKIFSGKNSSDKSGICNAISVGMDVAQLGIQFGNTKALKIVSKSVGAAKQVYDITIAGSKICSVTAEDGKVVSVEKTK